MLQQKYLKLCNQEQFNKRTIGKDGSNILDINKKQELLIKRLELEILKKAKEISSIRDAEIIVPIERFEKKIRELYKIEYPISKEIPIDNFNLNKIIEQINLNSEELIWPYCFESKNWMKLIDQTDFFHYIYENGYIKSISIISLADYKAYDIELGEYSYEIRINTI